MLKLSRLANVNNPQQLARRVSIVRWIVPFVLFAVVLFFETSEHIVGENNADVNFSFELIVFGVIGPALVLLILTWIHEGLIQLAQAQDEIRALNANLEQRVYERTVELAQANQQLQQLDRLKTEFVSLVSHELRTPLTNIQGGLELILQDDTVPNNNSLYDILQVVQSEVLRLSNLVKNILDVSAIEAGHLRLNRGTVMLRPLITQVWESCSLTGQIDHQLVVTLAKNAQTVWADENRLADVLTNLLGNAVKYSAAGSLIQLSAARQNDQIHLMINDEGIGISEVDRARIFDMFHRGEEVTKQNIQGFGLGLYFCKKIIQAQGGDIWVEERSDGKQGACFHIVLPIDRLQSHNGDETGYGDKE